MRMLKFKGLLFDDYGQDELGTWSRICKDCVEKHSDIILVDTLDYGGSGICGVCGCNVSDWEEDDAKVSYIDFEDGEFEIIDVEQQYKNKNDGSEMNNNKEHILDLIINMWENNLREGNGTEDFEDWCESNIENEEQIQLMNAVKDYVDKISWILK